MRPRMLVIAVTVAVLLSATSISLGGASGYCTDEQLADPKGNRGGNIDFRGAELLHRSQVERTNTKGLYRYRYCVENKHSHMPVVILWHDKDSADKTVFDRPVPQQAKRPQFHDSLVRFKNADMRFNYGPRKGQWDGSPLVNSIYHAAPNLPPPVQFIQFGDSQSSQDVSEILKSYDGLKAFLDKGGSVNLLSGAVIDIPTTAEAAAYLNGNAAEPPRGGIEFVTVEVLFSSRLERDGTRGYRVRSIGSFNAPNPEALTKATETGKAQFSVDKNSSSRLGKIEQFRFAPLEKGEKGGNWLVAQQPFESTLEEVRGHVTILSGSQRQVTAFPFTFFALRQ